MAARPPTHPPARPPNASIDAEYLLLQESAQNFSPAWHTAILSCTTAQRTDIGSWSINTEKLGEPPGAPPSQQLLAPPTECHPNSGRSPTTTPKGQKRKIKAQTGPEGAWGAAHVGWRRCARWPGGGARAPTAPLLAWPVAPLDSAPQNEGGQLPPGQFGDARKMGCVICRPLGLAVRARRWA
jgi:hypothetical protein